MTLNGWHDIADMKGQHAETWTFLIVISIAILFLLWGVLRIIYDAADEYRRPWILADGVIVDRAWQGNTQSTNVGMAVGQNGAMPMVTTSGSPEQFVLFVREAKMSLPDRIFELTVGMNAYFSPANATGSRIKFQYKTGRYTRQIFEKELI